MREIRGMSPGKLGHGCNPREVKAALSRDPHYIAVDAGSTDMGAFYMGTGQSFFHPLSIEKDLETLLPAALDRQIPLIIGSSVAIGTAKHLALAAELVERVARRLGLQFRATLVSAEQNPASLKRILQEATIPPLGASSNLTVADIDTSTVIVAQMGVEPLIKALDTGAQVVIAGRACDDALFAALPVREGFDHGLAMHMGKILECGSMASIPGDLHGSMVGYLREDHFVLEPPAEHRRCTVQSVAGHTLYEREHPYLQPGPGGVNDLTDCVFEQLDERRVKVSGSRWVKDSVYRVKLEGVTLAGYRTVCMTGIRDPILIQVLAQVLDGAVKETAERFAEDAGAYQVYFRQYGRNAVMGNLEPERERIPHEVGLLIEVIAETQELADAVCMFVRGSLQHAWYPGCLASAGNLAYPFSPFTVSTGPVYRFHIDHLLAVDNPCAPFIIDTVEVGVVAVPVG
jgi:hypothetical protein